MPINGRTLETELERRGLSQNDLADLSGVSAKTISRIKKGGRQNSSTIKRIASALGKSPEALAAAPDETSRREAEVFLRKAGFRRLRSYIDGQTALSFSLVEDRYRVSATALIEAAPLLFTLLAEMSLADRRTRLAAFRAAAQAMLDAAPSHLICPNFQIADAIESEEASIDARDLTGTPIDGALRFDDDDNLFVEYLKGLSAAVDPEAIDYVDAASGVLSYRILSADLVAITNGDSLAEFALERGFARINAIPAELRRSGQEEQRAAWLAAKVPETARLEHEARLREIESDLLELSLPDGGEVHRDE
jgi:transcriptional regulator with XRE-family HTH domain